MQWHAKIKNGFLKHVEFYLLKDELASHIDQGLIQYVHIRYELWQSGTNFAQG